MPEVRTTSSTGGQKGTKLARFGLIPVGPLTELAEHYGVGASKYANDQWRQGYEWSKSYDALMRHLTAFWAGQDYDLCSNDPTGCRHTDLEGNPFVAVREDACFNHTGSHHMAAVAWHAFLLLEFKDAHQQHDDRYVAPAAEPEIDMEAEAELMFPRAPQVGEEAGSPARWVRDYDIEHQRLRNFPRVDTGLPTLADALANDDFAFVDMAGFQGVINREVERLMLAEDKAVEDRLREQYGPDLLAKRRPIKDTPQA